MAKEFLLVDGYNIIHAWDELKELAEDVSLESARQRLMDVLSNYKGTSKATIILVFDGYLVKGNIGTVYEYNNIYVVYTKEAETADHYIERVVTSLPKHYKVRVATGDGLEQLIIYGQGAIRMTARERVLKALHFEKPDRMPFEISWGAFTPSLRRTWCSCHRTKSHS